MDVYLAKQYIHTISSQGIKEKSIFTENKRLQDMKLSVYFVLSTALVAVLIGILYLNEHYKMKKKTRTESGQNQIETESIQKYNQQSKREPGLEESIFLKKRQATTIKPNV
ncbi:MAG: hypothetical protein PHT87_03940 [Bacteroidales bacterium]|nr:hypothetical protein [Bacteroidales bacterium]MDD4640624.1 hypothetical protein [Bacteroidales bacterium]